MEAVRQRTWTDEDLAAVFDRFFPPLYDVAVRALGSQADAGAAVGRAFARAFAELRRRPVDDLRPWLYGLLAAELPRRKRSKPPETHRYATIDPDRLANPAAILRDERIPDEIWAAVSALPVEDYLLLDLQLRQGLRDPEVSRALRIESRSLDSRRERLRRQLEGGVDSPISAAAVFAAFAPVQPPSGLQRDVWATVKQSPPPRRERRSARPRKPIVIAAVIALLAASATAGAFIATRSQRVHDPISVHSTSHSTEHGSSDPNVEVSWAPSTDARGYSVSWTAEPGEPDKTVDLPSSSTGTTGHLQPGTHWFNLRTLGLNGRWTGTVHLGPFVILVDTVAPDTIIEAGPKKYAITVATFEFSSDEKGASLECSLDGETLEPCASPKTYTGLVDGKHTFRVRATDPAGNTDPTPARREWQVDAKAPNTELTDSPGDYAKAKARFEFGSSEGDSTFECKLDDGKWASCASPKGYSDLGEGAHHFHVRAIDRVGNRDSSPARRTWTVDRTPPQTSIESGPNAISHKSSATFSISSEANATFQCKLDDGAWADCAPITGLDDGKHVFKARAKDRAGNVDRSPAVWKWRVDLPPKTKITGGPSGPTSSTSASFHFTSDDSSATFECKLDGQSWSACSSGKTYSSLPQGKHAFRVRAKDASGTRDQSPAERTWTVDTVAPKTTITSGPKASTSSSSASFSFTSSESGVTFECRLDAGTWKACSSGKGYKGLENGNHVFRVRAVDEAENVDKTPAAWSWTIH
jgi:DNA-directed RNA polymerase specialized sigma24 family protein